MMDSLSMKDYSTALGPTDQSSSPRKETEEALYRNQQRLEDQFFSLKDQLHADIRKVKEDFPAHTHDTTTLISILDDRLPQLQTEERGIHQKTASDSLLMIAAQEEKSQVPTASITAHIDSTLPQQHPELTTIMRKEYKGATNQQVYEMQGARPRSQTSTPLRNWISPPQDERRGEISEEIPRARSLKPSSSTRTTLQPMMGQLATPQFTSTPPPEEIQQNNPPIYRKPEILLANELQETNLLELGMGNVPERPLESQHNPPPRKMEAGYHYPSTQSLPPWSN